MHTPEFIIFFCNGNNNERLLHLRSDPKPIEVNQKNCCLFCGLCKAYCELQMNLRNCKWQSLFSGNW